MDPAVAEADFRLAVLWRARTAGEETQCKSW
jgi:hypothetical protein